MASHDHNQITMCSYSSSRFSFVFTDKKGERKLTFITPMGLEMDPLIRTYSTFYRANYKLAPGADDLEQEEEQGIGDDQAFLTDSQE